MRWRVGFYPTTALELLILLTVAAFVVEARILRQWPRLPAPIILPVVLFVAAGAVSVFVAPDRVRALGLYRAYIIEPAAFFVVVTNITHSRRRFLLVLAGLAAAGIVASVLNVGAVLSSMQRGSFQVGGTSPAAIYETPNALALFLGPLVAVAGALAVFESDRRTRAVAAAFLLIAMPAMALSQSRGGYLTLAAIGLGLAFAHPRRRLLVPLTLASVLVLASLPPVTARLAHELNLGDPANTFASRLRLWAATLRLLKDHPLFGTGLSGFMGTIGPYRQGQFTETLMYPHNIVLNAWTETGLLGLASFAWLFLVTGRVAWRGWRVGAMEWRPIQLGVALAILAVAVHGLVDVPYWKNDLSLEFWALVGLTFAGRRFAAGNPVPANEKDKGRVRAVTILTRMSVGGPSRHVTVLATKMGELSGVLLIGKPQSHEGSLAEDALKAGAVLITVPGLRRDLAPLDDLKALLWLYRYFRRVRPDVVSTHTAKAGLLGRLAALLAGVPVRIHTFHGHVLHGYFGALASALLRLMERMLAIASSRLIAVSPEIAGDLDRFNIGRGKTVVIRLGFDLDPMATGVRGRLRASLELGANVPLVGIVARLAPVKDHDLFLEAARLLLQRRPDVRFAVIGDGDLWGRLQEVAKRLGIADCVFFTGWRHDLPDVYADLDVVVCSSSQEGTPVALIEACAAGRPVVSTNVGGVPDIIVDGETGILVPSRDGPALAAAIERVLSDRPLAVRLGEAGRKLARERFHADRMVAETTTLYLGLLAESVSRGDPIIS